MAKPARAVREFKRLARNIGELVGVKRLVRPTILKTGAGH
jgi:hypothetical protein